MKHMKHYHFNLLPIMEFHKGGSAPMPQAPDPRREAEARDWEAQQQFNRDKIEREYQTEQKRLQNEKDVAASGQRVSRGYDSAVSYGNSKLNSRGIDPTAGYGEQVSNLYRSALDRARAGAPEIVNDANSLFTPTLYDDAYGTVRSQARSGLNKQLNEFMGDGFDYDTFADTADDDIIGSILGEQKTEAQTALDRAKARGQVNDAGYASGLKELGNQELSGKSKANQLGQGVLSGYRKGLTDYGAKTRTRVDNYDLGDDFNIDSTKNRLGSMTEGYKSSLHGDILSALGGQNFFNTDTLIGKAGNASGITNNAPVGGSASTGLLGQPLGKTSAAGSTLESDKKNEVF